ncbi:ABC transporter [Marinitoga hydrogenitolerans DSM 16785]|uniref:ABC transporter n=1 Tax=Marinitoga hydrogenitolerans (strain DSM 16785 / JCM 12826 / AT1271) TaxID=1122195 RepID=A0A1M5ARF4_MARH1|nr:ATP-binding cassette domain-containing protein [Marinitoga hydrogenitolerans]SHF32677.1 ABC transporter [Marinitoga hydrogenitolerans DSM 16785]
MDFKIIKFKNIKFKYENRLILNDLNLEIKKGDKLAIVGPSGEGKSTILKLLSKLITPVSGKIYVDNIDLNDISDDIWYENIGMLSQNTHIFNRSFIENIKIGKRNASDEEIKKAIKFSGLNKFVEKNGVDTLLGKNGLFLSGGERTRVALARIFLKNPKLLILDEPLEGVDKENESSILKNIDKFVKDKTVILVSHRFTILSLAKEFAILKDGKIIEKNKFKSMSKNGILKKYYQLELNNLKEFNR